MLFENKNPVKSEVLLQNFNKCRNFEKMLITSVLSYMKFSIFQMDSLLDAMRIREELEIQERKRRRLMRAKTQVYL